MTAQMHDLNTPGTYIRVRREELNLTLQEIALRAEITASYLARIEKDMHIPRDESTIRSIEQCLHFDEGFLVEYFAYWRTTRSLRNLRNLMELIRTSIRVMKANQFEVVSRIDHRISSFNEDKRLLALNFIEYLSGDLGLAEMPENGLRPLSHYVIEFAPEIVEKWSSDYSKFMPPESFKDNSGLRGKPDGNDSDE